MRSNEQTDWIALLCDQEGIIQRIVQDELGISDRIVPGWSLIRLVDRGSMQKLLNFLLELRTRGAAFDWELNVPLGDQLVTLHFGGGTVDDELLVIGARSRDDVLQLYEDMMRISNEQTNTLRATTKERVTLSQSQTERDNQLYDEISRLNNELVTLQRELAKKNAEQRALNKKLQQLNQLKNTFVGIAAHDLRNPLANVHLAATFLVDTWQSLSEAEVEQLLQDIARQTQYMAALVSDLLDVSQIETGKLELTLQEIDLVEFLAEVVQRHHKMATAKRSQVQLEPADEVTIIADPNRLRQVMDNLLSNAVKFSPPGSLVQVNLEQMEAGWRVNVQDEGPGITEEDRQHLFQDFARLSARPTAGEESTGLGLAITRRIVETHGGQIGVESKPGQGSNFWFTLPNRGKRR
jgi:signal transduction histidine kinase